MSSATCAQHEASPAVGVCGACSRSVCEVCHFAFGSTTYCPECVSAGASEDERSSVFVRGLISMGLAVAGFAILAGFFVASMLQVDLSAWEQLLGIAWFGCSLAGVATGLVARDSARRTGSILPTIGIAANGILMVVQLLLSFIGNTE